MMLWRSVVVFPFLLAPLFSADWQPVSPAELAEKVPVVEKDADSEAIFWDVSVKDEVISGRPHTVLSHYIRVKIFNERGRDRWRTIAVDFANGVHVSDIAARTITPDGSIVEVSRDAFHQQNLVRAGRAAIRQVSWAMPAVEPGAIIEYRYIEAREDRYSHYVRLDFQLVIPARIVRYAIKPYSAPNFPFQMYMEDFQCPHTVGRLGNGFYLATLSNVPAFRPEPFMPPVNRVRPWSLVYYRAANLPAPDKFWSNYAKAQYNAVKGRLKITKEIQEKAAEITAGKTSDEQKLAAISDFCRSRIRNLQTDAVSAEEREEADKNKTPADTLSQGMGSSMDIDYLFIALANAAGFDARIAKCANRNDAAFNPDFLDAYFLRDALAAVKLASGWHFYEPDAAFVPHDMIPAYHEGVTALIADPKDAALVQTPASGADQTEAHREGFFRLAEDGTLEGNVNATFSGHLSEIRKQTLLRQSDAQREEAFEKETRRMASGAEVSNIKIENATDPDKPLIYHCHLRVPGYAQRTGKRLFFAPEVFQQAQTSRFPENQRRYPVYFPFAETELDEVSIEIPAGFAFDAPNVPAAIPVGDAGKYQVTAKIEDRKRLIYTRRLILSKPSGMLIPVESYPVLKKIFDEIASADQFSLALKQASSATAVTGSR